MIPPVWLVLPACTRPEPARPPDLATLGQEFEAHRRDVEWTDRPLLPGLGGAWQARAGRVRAWFLPDTTWLVDRAATVHEWKVGLTATALGRGEALRVLGAGTSHADGPWYERVRDGVVEWFHARPDGLEHGFTVLDRPPGDGPMVLEITVDGASPVAMPDGARFVTDGATRLYWRGLVVTDADRRLLATSVTTSDATLRLTIDDTDARWPVKIDPLLTLPTDEGRALTGGPTPNWYGFSIDSDGEQLVVGNPGDPDSLSGAAVLLERNLGGADLWGQVEEFLGSDEPRIGYSVAIDGPTVAIGAPLSGDAYIYRNDGAGWFEEGHVGPLEDAFGTSMDLDDETLVVGDPAAAVGGLDAGEVRVYNRYVGWGEIAVLAGAPNQKLGSSVSLSGDGFVAGAPGTNRAFVYRMNAGGLPAPGLVETLTEASAAGFGRAVAMDGGRIAVGAPGSGRVYLYRLDVRDAVGETWTLEGSVDRPDTTGFGSAVALWGDALAVTDLPVGGSAQVHLFELRGGAWSYVESFVAGETSVGVPVPVTLGASLLAVGLPEDPSASFRVWRRDSDRWIAEDTDVAPSSLGPNAKFGMAAAATGDRVVVGAPGDDSSGVESGSIVTYVRGEHGSWTYHGETYGTDLGERYGSAVAADGDLTLVGAPERLTVASPVTAAGAAELLTWDGTGYLAPVELLPEEHVPDGDWPNLDWGEAVAIDTLFAVVGAPGRYPRGGAAFVFGRNQGGVADSWDLYAADVASGVTGEQMGETVALAGGHLIVGGPDCDPPAGAAAGCLEIYDLDDTTTALQTLEGGAAGDRFGTSIAVDGNLMAVGTPGYNADIGAVRVYQLKADGSFWEELAVIDPVAANPDQFGYQVALSGDRLYVSTHDGDSVEVRQRNGPAGAGDVWSFTEELTGTAAGSRFGESLATAHDTLVIGEPWLVAPPEQGRVHLLQRDAAHPPVVHDDTFGTTEDSSVNVAAPGFLGNDHDPDGDPLVEITRLSDPSNGVVTAFGADGSFTYVPDPDFYGDDSFDYSVSDGVTVVHGTVTIDVTSENDAPTARPDGPYPAVQDELFTATASQGVLTNDDDDIDDRYDPDGGNVLTAEPFGVPLLGLTLSSDGGFTYQPPAGLIGTVQFQYVAVDEGGDGLASAPALVTIDIGDANDSPVGPDRLPDYEGLQEDATFVVPPPGLLDPALGISDPDDDDVLHAEITDPPDHGTLVVDRSGGWRYRPDPNYYDDDRFSYQVVDNDGLPSDNIDVTLYIDSINDDPVAQDDGPYDVEEDRVLTIGAAVLLANDTDVETPLTLLHLAGTAQPAHGRVTFEGVANNVVYTPDADWSGVDSFGYIADDGGGGSSEVTLVSVRVTAVNDRPVAVDDDLGEIDAPISGAVLANDFDADQDPPVLTAQLVGAPLGGSLVFAPDGAYTYTPHPDFVGADSFLYRVTDPEGAVSELATARVVVVPGDPGKTPPTTTIDDTGCAESTWFHDGDGDGFGDASTAAEACAAPTRHVDRAGDCDDDRADTHPGAPEAPDDGLDQDCDGLDNLARPAGACDTGGGAVGLLAVMLTTLLLRRRGDA